jgi:hypothetical protein
MARKAKKKAYRPPVAPTPTPSSEGTASATAATPMPEARSKRVKEVKVSAKDQALARKKAARARWFDRTA